MIHMQIFNLKNCLCYEQFLCKCSMQTLSKTIINISRSINAENCREFLQCNTWKCTSMSRWLNSFNSTQHTCTHILEVCAKLSWSPMAGNTFLPDHLFSLEKSHLKWTMWAYEKMHNESGLLLQWTMQLPSFSSPHFCCLLEVFSNL